MKRVFFLLALCACERVFADQFLLELANLHDRNMHQMNGIVQGVRSAIEGKVKGANGTPGVTDCWREFDEMVKAHQLAIINCDECHKKAVQHRNIEIARKCYGYNILALVTKGNFRRTRTKQCIKRIRGAVAETAQKGQ